MTDQKIRKTSGHTSGAARSENARDVLPRLHLRAAVLEEAREFFERCGVAGCEGTALIAGTFAEDQPKQLVGDTLVIPDQQARPVPCASVTVTETGDLKLAAALQPGQRYLSRIHSHPGQAFHSSTDDANPALTHEGAFSVVVPYFGLGLRAGLDACAIYVRLHHQWVELPVGSELRKTLVSTDA